MTKQHIKALHAPRTWNVARHATTFITRPNAGGYSFEMGLSLNHVLKHELKVTSTTKESQVIINNRACTISGRPATDIHHLVGFMDVVSFPSLKKHYRMTLTTKGKLSLVEISEKESSQVLSKIMRKYFIKGNKLMAGTLDGRTFPATKELTTGSSVLLEVPSQKIKSMFKLSKGALVMLIGGKHKGDIGIIESITDDNVVLKSTASERVYQTLKEYVFVLGEDNTPAITIR